MCLAVPACIVSITGDDAELDIGGLRRAGSLALIETPQVGDWVVLHGGIALGRIDPTQAADMLARLQAMREAA